jgi:transposase
LPEYSSLEIHYDEPWEETMISLSFQEFFKANPDKARQKIVELHGQLGSIKATALVLGCSKNTAKKWIRRYHATRKLEERSRRPQNSPKKTPRWLEDKVIALRRRTNLGRRRIARQILIETGYELSPNTIREIFSRNDLSKPQRLRGRFKGVRFFRRQHLDPLTFWQIDVKDVRDGDTLPKDVYDHLLDKGLPRYQWTAIDVRTRTKFLGYSHQLRHRYGLKFWALLTAWLRAHGMDQRLFYQTDWGSEFGGTTFWKLERIQRRILDPWNVQLLRIRKGQWKDNAYVERTHRTDDEEFYVPRLKTMRNHQDHFKQAWAYNFDFNVARGHDGHDMKGKTPQEVIKSLGLDLPLSFFALPPILMDSMTANQLIRGHDLLTTYSRSKDPCT